MMKTCEQQLVQTILNESLLQALKSYTRRIKSLHIVIGEIAELDQNIIQQYWKQIRKNTPAEQAQLYFRLISAEVQCMSCFNKYHPMDGKIHCPHCGSFGAKILSGEEFYLESIEMDYE